MLYIMESLIYCSWRTPHIGQSTAIDNSRNRSTGTDLGYKYLKYLMYLYSLGTEYST
jgi:hypothetical protein